MYFCITDYSGRADEEFVEGNREADLGTQQTGPQQIKQKQYPLSSFGLQRRCFQDKWFESFEWLEYSVSQNAAFCFSCRLYGKQVSRVNQDALISTVGFSNWKRALDSFRQHETSAAHKASMLAWREYKASLIQGDVLEQMNVANVGQIIERREYLRRVVAVTSFLGKQGIAFRGHNETAPSVNQGNFLELMKLLEQFDPFLQNYKAPSNSTYLSPSSQNEIIECCAGEVTASIIEEMKESKMYAVMADEARDGHVEQLAVCVRYVRADCTVKERFLELANLKGFNAQSITDAIEHVLESNGLNNLLCVAQAYDGASVMSGAVGGVQARFREKHPEAVYVHCYAHELNLVLCHTCRTVPEASDLFETLESVYCFFSVSLVNHQAFADVQKLLGLAKSELVQLSKTRWACQLQSVKVLMTNLTAVLRCLEEIGTSMAVGLLSKLSRFSSVYMLVMFRSMLSTTEGLHVYLQKSTVDLAQATHYKDAVLEGLKSMRTDEMAKNLYNEAKAICEANNISETITGHRRKQRRMEEYTVESPLGTRAHMSTEGQLRCNIFYPCLDRMISEIKSRFSGVGAELMKGIQACNPAADDFLSEDSLSLIATHYNITLSKEEIMVAKHFLRRRKEEGTISDMASVYKLLDPDMFPTLSSVFKAALTIPVSSCSCERSFSALRRLHTWLRTTMGQDRLNHLAVLSIEKETLNGKDPNKVIDRFAKLKTRRYTLMVPPAKK